MVALRELTAKLGFDVDMTGVNRFEKGIDSSRRKVEGFNFVNLGGFRNTLNKTFVLAGTAFAALGTSAAAAFKFGDVKAALNDLEQGAKGGFGAIKKSIDDILADKLLENLVKELDLVNAGAVRVREGFDPRLFADLLAPATLFAINARKTTTEIFSGISSFIEGANLDILRQTGVLNQSQIELLKAAGVGPGKEGIVARTERIRSVFAGLEGELRTRTQALVESGALTARELTGALDKLVLEVGERTLPAFKGLNDELIPFVEGLTKLVRGDIGIREVLAPRAAPGSERAKRLEEFKGGLTGQAQFTFDFIDFLLPSLDRANKAIKDINIEQRGVTPQLPLATTGGAEQRTNVNVTNNVTVQGGGGGNAAEIGREVEKANRRTLGSVKELNERTTLRKGG